VFSTALPPDDAGAARAKGQALEEIGVTQLGMYAPYESAAEFKRLAETIVRATGR